MKRAADFIFGPFFDKVLGPLLYLAWLYVCVQLLLAIGGSEIGNGQKVFWFIVAGAFVLVTAGKPLANFLKSDK